MHRPTRTAALVAATAITIAACGGTNTSTSTDSGPTAEEAGPTVAGPSTATSPLPAVDVLDVVSGETVQLAGFLPAAKPTLVWMWAPN